MPTVQEFMPFFQELLNQWRQLTLDNVSYAVALGGSVWFLSAIVYNLRIAVFKHRRLREQQARLDAQNRLDTVQQALNTSQAEVSELSSQLDQHRQSLDTATEQIADLEHRLRVNQQKLIEACSHLLEKFELIDSLSGKNDTDLNSVWEHFNSIIARISERFASEQQAKTRLQLDIQAEKMKIADKELLVNSLQVRLENQAGQLERNLAEETALRSELEHLKQQLATAQTQHAFANAPKVEPQQAPVESSTVFNATAIVDVMSEPTPLAISEPVPPTTIDDADPSTKAASIPASPRAQIVEEKARAAELISETVEEKPLQLKPVTENTTLGSDKTKWKNLFGSAVQKLSRLDEKLGTEIGTPEPAASEADRVETVIEIKAEDLQVITEPAITGNRNSVEPDEAASSKASWKNMLGNAMQQFAKMDQKLGSTTVTPVIDNSSEEASQSIEESTPIPSVIPTEQKTSKLGALFSKLKKI